MTRVYRLEKSAEKHRVAVLRAPKHLAVRPFPTLWRGVQNHSCGLLVTGVIINPAGLTLIGLPILGEQARDR
jgi:hypothetical protein